MGELLGQLHRILDDYQVHGRDPRMVLAVIAGLTREVEKEWGVLPSVMNNIGLVVAGWEEGRRLDIDALETIAGMVSKRYVD